MHNTAGEVSEGPLLFRCILAYCDTPKFVHTHVYLGIIASNIG